MVKKNTNEHDYFKNIKDFLTYHFKKTPGNETKLANVLEYCKLNWKSIGENEVANMEDENVKTLLELQISLSLAQEVLEYSGTIGKAYKCRTSY